VRVTKVSGGDEELVDVTRLAVERDVSGHVTGSGVDGDVSGWLSVDVRDRVD